jgi:hypothetical protein
LIKLGCGAVSSSSETSIPPTNASRTGDGAMGFALPSPFLNTLENHDGMAVKLPGSTSLQAQINYT